MTAEIESDETSNDITKELLELGLIHEVKTIEIYSFKSKNSCYFFQSDYTRVEQSIHKAFNMTTTSPDVIPPSLLDVKKTAVVAATAALITAQALQNQLSTSTNPSETLIDSHNASTWTNHQPVMFLPT
jgi:hypothetical protein